MFSPIKPLTICFNKEAPKKLDHQFWPVMCGLCVCQHRLHKWTSVRQYLCRTKQINPTHVYCLVLCNFPRGPLVHLSTYRIFFAMFDSIAINALD